MLQPSPRATARSRPCVKSETVLQNVKQARATAGNKTAHAEPPLRTSPACDHDDRHFACTHTSTPANPPAGWRAHPPPDHHRPANRAKDPRVHLPTTLLPQTNRSPLNFTHAPPTDQPPATPTRPPTHNHPPTRHPTLATAHHRASSHPPFTHPPPTTTRTPTAVRRWCSGRWGGVVVLCG